MSLSRSILVILYLVNESLYFFTYLLLLLDFSEFFVIYPLLILKESLGQTKQHRYLRFGTHSFFILAY